jgi:hypothetical protein
MGKSCVLLPYSEVRKKIGGICMSIDITNLAKRVAALESRIAASDKKEEDSAEEVDTKEASERQVLAAQIEALELKLNAADDADDEDDEKVEDKADEKKASLVDPDGVEEQITQKYLTEVEDLEHGTELATNDSTLDAAPTGYVARLKSASARLDVVAEYLEKSGRTAMALRIDKIADSIDARVAKFESKS